MSEIKKTIRGLALEQLTTYFVFANPVIPIKSSLTFFFFYHYYLLHILLPALACSMTDGELDGKVQMDESRIIRVAKGSGVHPQEVVGLLDTYKQFEKMIDGMNKGGLLKGGDAAFQSKMMRNPNAVLSQMQKSMDPRMLKNMGGMQNLASMMKGLAKGE